MSLPSAGIVVSVASSGEHSFSKPAREAIRLTAGLGVEGDAHAGQTVKHRSRVAKDPTQPNLRQVHLVASETLDDLAARGFRVGPGDIGENVLTRGIDLFALPQGAELHLGEQAVVRITGLRNPCAQLDRFQPGLMLAVLGRHHDGSVALRAGVMGIVLASGAVRAGDGIRVVLPDAPHRRLERV